MFCIYENILGCENDKLGSLSCVSLLHAINTLNADTEIATGSFTAL